MFFSFFFWYFGFVLLRNKKLELLVQKLIEIFFKISINILKMFIFNICRVENKYKNYNIDDILIVVKYNCY